MMWVSGDGVDDDGGVVLAQAADFDGLGAVIDDNHLFEIDFGEEVFASLDDIADIFSPYFMIITHLFFYAWLEF